MNKNKYKYYCGNEQYYCKYVEYLNEAKKDLEKGAKKWKEIINECNSKPYIDPDTTHNKDPYSTKIKNGMFYKDLSTYLKNCNKNEIVSKKIISINFCWKDSKYKTGIKVNINNKEFLLRSDQFGFSAPQHKKKINQNKNTIRTTNFISKAWKIKDKHTKECFYPYPYSKYLLINKKDEDSDFIASMIWNTRQIGGSLLWPKIIGCNYNINFLRGAASYIEDRIDLTLLEIKDFYNIYSKTKNFNDLKNIMNNEKYILMKGKDNKAIFEWLSNFETFNNYVDFFSFESFVKKDGKEYNVINIFTGKAFTMDELIIIKKNRLQGNGQIKKMSNSDINTKKILKNMFINLNNQTLERTRIMEGIINGETNKK